MRSQREKQTKSKIRAKNSDNGVPDSPNVVEKWGKQVEGWFAQAKPDDNGRVNGHDAVAFFKRSGLDYDDLAKVWDKVVPPKDDKMDRRQFESALKLVALLQTGGELSDKTAVEAIAQAVPDPEPVIGPLERSPSPSLIPCPPCLNPHAGETGWLSKKAYVSSRLPAGDDRIGKTPSGSARSTVAENGAPRSRSFTGMPSSRYNDEGASHKTPGKGEQPPPSNERIRSASMPGRLNEDPDQLGRPATGALRFVRLDKKVVKSSTMPKGIGGGRPGLAVAAERDEHPVEDEYVGDVDEEWTVLSDRVDRGKEQRAVNKSRRGNNRTPGTAVPFMDGRVYGLGTQSAPASAYNSLIAGARPLEGSLEDVKEQANRDSPIPDRLDSADEHVARGSPIPKRRASADYYVGKGGHKSGRSPQGSDYPDNDVAKPARSTVADDRRGRTRNVLDGSQPVDDVLARELPVPGQSKTENDAAGGRQSPGRVAADAGPVPGTSGMTVDKGATQGSPSPGRGGEREARTGTGSTTSGRPADANVPEVKTRTRPRRFEEMHDDERGGVPPGRFAEAEEQVNNNNSVNSVSAGDLAPRGVSMHSRSVAIIPYDEDDEDSRDHPERLGYNPERPMLRSFTPSSLGGRSSRSQTPAFSDDIMSQLAGSDLTKDAQEPCTAGLVNVELRLPPLRPTTSAKLTKVAAVNGSLVAFPSVTGGLLQWIGIQDSLDGTRDLARVSSEDPDSAACVQIDSDDEANITSYAVHDASGFLWLGHENGMVSSWYVGGSPQKISRKVSAWQGHRHGSVSAMAITPWGALWTGSTKGSVRVWESPTSEGGPTKRNSLSRTRGDKPHGTVKDIAVSACGSLVWTCGQNKLALWDAYTRKFLGLIERSNEDKIIDTRRGIETEDELVSSMSGLLSEMENSSGKSTRHTGGLVSKNGRRVAEKSYTQPQVKDFIPTKMGSIKALVAQGDGTIWVGYKNGVIERYYQNGRFIKRWGLGSRLMSLCSVGECVWAGLRDGSIVVLVSELEAIFKWQAHTSAVISMAVSGGAVCTLGDEGSIKCWSCQIPNPDLDEEAWVQWQACIAESIEHGQLKMLCGTWNVGHCKPSPDSLRDWLGGGEKADDADLVVVGLQQTEDRLTDSTNAATVDARAATEQQGPLSLPLSSRAKRNGGVRVTCGDDPRSRGPFWKHGRIDSPAPALLSNGKCGAERKEQNMDKAQWWASELLSVLEPHPANSSQGDRWQTIGMRQMSGILVAVFARERLCPYIGNISTTCVACGVAPSGESKGAVALQCTLFRRPLLAVVSHISAHQDCVLDANDDCDGMELVDLDDAYGADAPSGWAMQMVLDDDEAGRGAALQRAYGRADMVVWLGDFNYRLDLDYDDAMGRIQDAIGGRGSYAELLKHSRCQDLMAKGSVFPGMQEAPIEFQPTYKFDKDSSDLLAYESGEGRQVPAYTDRIFFRGSVDRGSLGLGMEEGYLEERDEGLLGGEGDPTALLENSPRRISPSDVTVQCERYDTVLGPTESAHKPVWGLLSMDYPVIIQGRKRARCFEILRQVAAHDVDGAAALVEVTLRSNYFELAEGDVQELEVENRGACKAQVSLVADQSMQQFIPHWLQVKPVTICVHPGFSEIFTLSAIVGACDGYQAALPARLSVRAEGVVGNWGRRGVEHAVDVRLLKGRGAEGEPPMADGDLLKVTGEEAC